MALTFIDPDPAASSALDALAGRLGSNLPSALRTLLTTVSNGGEVETVVYRADSNVGVVAVLGTGRGDDLDIEARIAQYADDLPHGLIPIADAEGGNLVCVSIRPSDFGTVWFWDHELELTGHSPRKIAESVERFLDDLAPYVPSGERPTVIEAWIDPSLLEEFG